MSEFSSRTRALVGDGGVEALASARVAVFGVGGVGSNAAEALARCGVGGFMLVDFDVVAESNLNRQIMATRETIGLRKVDAMRDRILSINPFADVRAVFGFYGEGADSRFDLSGVGYIIDAMDAVASKVALALRAERDGIPIVSCMGAGGRLDPTRFKVADIYDTKGCPLARAVRCECRRRGVRALKAVYSDEPPAGAQVAGGSGGERAPGLAEGAEGIAEGAERAYAKRAPLGAISFVAAAAGLVLAAEAARGIIGKKDSL